MSELLDDAVRELSRLPGIGRRTALRLTLHMLRMDMSPFVYRIILYLALKIQRFVY